MLELRGIHAGYGRNEILHGADLSCAAGTVTTILGENGCGKSTLLKAAAGIIPITDGEINIGGTSLSQLSGAERARRMAYLSQSRNIPDITAGRLVLHGRFPYLSYPRRYRREDYEAAAKAMDKLSISRFADKPLSELSGGIRQKVYIAMALAQQAEVILMDEPTAYLDIAHQLLLGDLAKELAAEGRTLVLVLHDILLALKISDRIAVLKNGRIALTGSKDEIISSGILREIYSIDVRSVSCDTGTEYYFTRCTGMQTKPDFIL